MAQPPDSVPLKTQYTIKINPLQLTFGEARFLVEKPLNDDQAIETIASFFSNYISKYISNKFDPLGNITYYGFKVGAGYRLYSQNHSQIRIYFNPLLFYKFINYRNVTEYDLQPIHSGAKPEEALYDVDAHIFSLQGHFGVYFITDKITCDLYLGLGGRYKFYVVNEIDNRPSGPYIHHWDQAAEIHSYTTIHAGLNIGYRIQAKSIK